jgi:hypothetical protein
MSRPIEPIFRRKPRWFGIRHVYSMFEYPHPGTTTSIGPSSITTYAMWTPSGVFA